MEKWHASPVRGVRTKGQVNQVNESMKREHYKRITDPVARRMYNRLCDACDRRADGLTDADQMLVADAAYAEQMKQALMADIQQRGFGAERRNGRQVYWQESKSPAQLRAFTELQRKLLAELKLTPAGRNAAPVNLNDDFDTFPDG